MNLILEAISDTDCDAADDDSIDATESLEMEAAAEDDVDAMQAAVVVVRAIRSDRRNAKRKLREQQVPSQAVMLAILLC